MEPENKNNESTPDTFDSSNMVKNELSKKEQIELGIYMPKNDIKRYEAEESRKAEQELSNLFWTEQEPKQIDDWFSY